MYGAAGILATSLSGSTTISTSRHLEDYCMTSRLAHSDKEGNKMANQEHLNLLQHGVETWNQWRRGHPDFQPDLEEADLSEMDLIGVNLSRAQLHGTTFFETQLDVADLSEADLGIADFRGADLSGAAFHGSDLGGANLSRADLSSTNFRRASL